MGVTNRAEVGRPPKFSFLISNSSDGYNPLSTFVFIRRKCVTSTIGTARYTATVTRHFGDCSCAEYIHMCKGKQDGEMVCWSALERRLAAK